MTDESTSPAETLSASAKASASAIATPATPAPVSPAAAPASADEPAPEPPAPADPPGKRDNITRISEAVNDCVESTQRAEQYAANAEQFMAEAKKAQKDAQQAITAARQAAEDTETLAKRVVEATNKALADAECAIAGDDKPPRGSFGSGKADAYSRARGGDSGMPSFPSFPIVRPVDEITATVAQLNNLVVGTAPAFATAMRLNTDAMASGIASHNAVSQQHNQNIAALIMHMRATANIAGKGE